MAIIDYPISKGIYKSYSITESSTDAFSIDFSSYENEYEDRDDSFVLVDLPQKEGRLKLIAIRDIHWSESNVVFYDDDAYNPYSVLPTTAYCWIPFWIWKDENSKEFREQINLIRGRLEEQFDSVIDGEFFVDLDPEPPASLEKLVKPRKIKFWTFARDNDFPFNIKERLAWAAGEKYCIIWPSFLHIRGPPHYRFFMFFVNLLYPFREFFATLRKFCERQNHANKKD